MLPSIKQPLSPENGEHYLTRAEVTGTWHHLTLEATRWTNKIIPENYLREIWNRLDLEFYESLGDSKMTVCSLKSPRIHLLFQYLRFISLVHPMNYSPTTAAIRAPSSADERAQRTVSHVQKRGQVSRCQDTGLFVGACKESTGNSFRRLECSSPFPVHD